MVLTLLVGLNGLQDIRQRTVTVGKLQLFGRMDIQRFL